MKRIHILVTIAFLSMIGSSCKKFMDVVPDNVATIENAFTLRSSAEKYLFTCYSYMPRHGHFNDNPAMTAGDEIWYMEPPRDVSTNYFNIARGLQNPSSPLGNFWNGTNGGRKLFTALRDCNIFLDNIGKVLELNTFEREQWIAEVKFLKAYYHYYLLRMYGPIPVIKTNLPISSTPEEVRVFREPADEGFKYIVELLDEAISNEFLPAKIVGNEAAETGRVTKAMAYALKAKVLVEAASPLFNGNTDFASLTTKGGQVLVNPVFDPKKWEVAAKACEEAIKFCHDNGFALHRFPGNFGYVLVPETQIELDIRTAVTEKFNNTEVIWANTISRANEIQRWAMPLITAGASTSGPKGILAPPIKMAEMFYTKNGVPITEDKTWDYDNRYVLKTAAAKDKYYIKEGQETVQLHFDREPRFYANLGFDRGVWYGNWVNNYNSDNLHFVRGRKGEPAAQQGISNFSITSYYIKKLVNITTTAASDGNITNNTQQYPWPEIRLADLYLMYAEALNEANGPSTEAYNYINLVRARAGVPTVQDSWSNFARESGKHLNKTGLREIIHRERSIELAFEGHRYWDLRRWKEAHIALNAPIKGWDITQVDAPSFYKEVVLFNQSFKIRDYFWPIEINEILNNRNLVQNPGW